MVAQPFEASIHSVRAETVLPELHRRRALRGRQVDVQSLHQLHLVRGHEPEVRMNARQVTVILVVSVQPAVVMVRPTREGKETHLAAVGRPNTLASPLEGLGVICGEPGHFHGHGYTYTLTVLDYYATVVRRLPILLAVQIVYTTKQVLYGGTRAFRYSICNVQ